MQKLLHAFKATSLLHLVIIFIVFGITGSAAVFLAEPILHYFNISSITLLPWLYWPLRILIIFPIYQCLLIVLGTLFGQFKYFWALEKKFLNRLGIRLP